MDKALFSLFKMEEIFKDLDALKKKKKFTTLKISCFHLGQWIYELVKTVIHHQIRTLQKSDLHTNYQMELKKIQMRHCNI